MLYHQATGNLVPKDVARDVNAFIKHHVSGKRPTCHRPKPVASKTDSIRLLHFLYTEDPAIYPDERQRVQQAFLILIHAYSGLRPSSTTSSGRKSSKKSPREQEPSNTQENSTEFAGLRYRDVEFILAQGEGGTRFAVRPRFARFKGGLRRSQAKTFTWWDRADVLLCPVAHVIALALHDKAFYSPSLNNVNSLLSLNVPPGRSNISLPWREDILDTHILRSQSDVGCPAELQGSVASKRLSRLGTSMGYEQPVTWYCLRRFVLNAIDASGSEEVRNQIAGHLDSRTYRNHYQDQYIQLDVANLVMGQPTEDELMRKLNDMSSNADPNANLALPPNAQEQIEALSDVAALITEYHSLADQLKEQYCTISRAPASSELYMAYAEAQRAVKVKKDFHRTQWKTRLRREHFAQKDILLIDAQLDGKDQQPQEVRTRQRKTSTTPERAALAELVGDAAAIASLTQEQKVTAIQALADLCHRVEIPKRSVSQSERTVLSERRTATSIARGVAFPVRCDTLQCLFCLGDERLSRQDRSRLFNRQQALWRHTQRHLDTLHNHCSVPCPHPYCKAKGVTLNNVQHLLNHAQKEHGIRLQARYVCPSSCNNGICSCRY